MCAAGNATPGDASTAPTSFGTTEFRWIEYQTTRFGKPTEIEADDFQINLQALIQYNDRDDIWAANLRFAWLRTANSGLYVVYNENLDIHRSGFGWTRKDRSLIVKYTYLFDLLK